MNQFSYGMIFRLMVNGKYLYVQSTAAKTYLGEIGAYDSDGNLIELKPYSENSEKLIDEQNVIPEESSFLNSTYFDEVYHPRAAYEYIHNLRPYEWVHPPLGKILIGLPVMFLGMNTFAYRLMGNIAGIIMIPIMYLIAKKLFNSDKYGLVSAIIMACDGMHFSQTRIATVDSFLVMFMMISYLFMIRYIKLPSDASFKSKLKELFFCGLFMGFAIDTKWSAMFGAMGLAVIFFFHFFSRIVVKGWKLEDVKTVGCCFVFFIVVPAVIYILSYYPFFSCPESEVKDMGSFIEHQVGMYTYHSELVAEHPYTSPWYTWPYLQKPVLYYVKYFDDGIHRAAISDIGNPIVWWGGLAGTIYMLVSFWTNFVNLICIKLKKMKDKKINNKIEKMSKESIDVLKTFGVILIMIATTFLCYIFIGRIMFLYHYFITLPFVMLALTGLIKFLDSKIKIKGISYVSMLAVAAVIMSFIYFYPIFSGKTVPKEVLEREKWFETWIW